MTTSSPTLTADKSRANGHAVEKALTANDFHFAFHPNPDRIFTRAQRPFRLIQGKPSLTTYGNAIYAPAIRNA